MLINVVVNAENATFHLNFHFLPLLGCFRPITCKF